MPRFVRMLFVVALLVLFPVSFANAQMPPPADKVFSLAASRSDDRVLTLRWTVEPGNYLYRDSLEVSMEGKTLPLEIPAGEEKDDPNFGHVQIFHDSVEGRLPGLPGAGKLQIRYQGCAEQGICYPPVAKIVDLETLAISGVRLGLGGEIAAERSVQGEQRTVWSSANAAAADPAEESATSYLVGNPFLMAAGFLGFGLLLAFTPCVFPMIPILSAMLAGAGGQLSVGRGFVLSSAYVLAMAAAYGIVGLVAGWSGANLQAALQTPAALLSAATVFIALALSMFGFYEIALPSALATRLSGGRSGGSVLGAAVLGLGSALIVGPCVTPPLAAAMLFAVQSGEAAKGAVALFFLGLGMGLPLIAFGAFGARILPRSGSWMVSIRQGFGIVFLGVAAMLVSRLLTPPPALALWGALAIGTGVFLGGFDAIRATSNWQRRLGKAAGLTVSLYGAALVVGAAGGASDPSRPLAFIAGQDTARTQSAGVLRVNSPASFDAAVAANSGKPILVSFGADWCTVCKSNDALMERPDIRKRLDALPVIDVDVTRQDAGARALMTRFAVVGPPTLFFLDAEGREVPGSRMIGPITADEIAGHLSLAGA